MESIYSSIDHTNTLLKNRFPLTNQPLVVYLIKNNKRLTMAVRKRFN